MTSNFQLTTTTTTKQLQAVNGGTFGQPVAADGPAEKETPFQLYLSLSQDGRALCEQCQTDDPGKAQAIAFLSQLFKEASGSEGDPKDQTSDPVAVLIAFLQPFAPGIQIQTTVNAAGGTAVAGDLVSTLIQIPVQEGAATFTQEGTAAQGQNLLGDMQSDTVHEGRGALHFLMTPSGEGAQPASAEEFSLLQHPGTEPVVTAGGNVTHIAAADLQDIEDAGIGTKSHAQLFSLHPHAEPAGTAQGQGPGESGAVRQTVTVTELTGIHRPILKALAAGERQLIIEIRPPDLGTLQIRLTQDRGIISANITVDSQAVRDMLSVALPQIRTSMEESGVSLREFTVDLRRNPDPQNHRRENQAEQGKKEKEQRGGGDHFLNLFA